MSELEREKVRLDFEVVGGKRAKGAKGTVVLKAPGEPDFRPGTALISRRSFRSAFLIATMRGPAFFSGSCLVAKSCS